MRYQTDTASLQLSVRELCAMALRGGDLEYGGGLSLSERGAAGARAHRSWQSRQAPPYQAEVSLHLSCLYGGICYEVSGRADGIVPEDGGWVIEEIKSVRSGQFFRDLPPAHQAQLECYAYFLCRMKGLDRVRLRWVILDIDRERERTVERELSVGKLRELFERLLGRIERWALLLRDHATEELPRLAGLPFPYSNMRLGQEEMIRAVHRSIRRGERLFVQAPTGIGKTISALYPAVRALGEGLCDRIFYLTAKGSTRREAFEAVRRMVETGAPLRAVVLTAREHICPLAGVYGGGRGLSTHCHGVECPYASGYYDRAPDAVYELLTGGRGYPRGKVAEVAEQHQVCPYELSLDVSEFCDVVIADYNYAFDPMVSLRRYFGSGATCEGKNVFLIDEAHNLVDRAREMYSARISGLSLERLLAKVDQRDRLLTEALDTGRRTMQKLKKLCHETLQIDENGREYGFYLSRAPLIRPSEAFAWIADQCREWLRAHGEETLAPQVRELCYTLREYAGILEYYDEHYVTYVELDGRDISLCLYCLDPSSVLGTVMRRACASVLFSATLTPLSYFCDVLGGESNAGKLSLPSPYERKNFGLFAVDSISTRYGLRTESVAGITACIAATISAKPGNYMAYFPSYSYMEQVYRAFCSRYPHVRTVLQKKGMRAAEKDTFLEFFPEDTGVLRIGFCVLGGSFSEGVNLPGSRLIGAIVVGVGLPGLSNQRNVLAEYFQNKCEQGYTYAYQYPGMNHVLQAGGRVIRREEDRGVVVLLDERYATPEYRMLLPEHWSHLQYAGNATKLAELVRDFWEREER